MDKVKFFFFIFKQAYQEHVRDQHYGIWSYKCGFCEESFQTQLACKKHAKKAHRTRKKYTGRPKKVVVKNPERCICDECGNSYRDKYALKSHIGKLYLRLDFTQIYSILLNLAQFLSYRSRTCQWISSTFAM